MAQAEPLTVVAMSDDKAFAAHKNQIENEFKQHLSQQEMDFMAMLKEQWQEMQSFQAQHQFSSPKPKQAPAVNPRPEKLLPKKQESKKTQPKKLHPVKLPTIKNQQDLQFNLYGRDLIFPKIKNLQAFEKNINNESIADYWAALALVIKPVSKALQETLEQYNAPDWLRYQLIKKYSEKSISDKNSQSLLAWALFNDMGIDARIGYEGNSIELLLPIKQNVYGSSYFTLSGQRYYRLSNESGRLIFYAAAVKKRALDLGFKKHSLNYFSHYPIQNIQLFDQNSKQMIDVRTRIIYGDYFFGYPAMDFAKYFNTQLELLSHKDLIKKLEQRTNGLNDFDKTQYLLTFVQYAFSYLTDQEQWGREYYSVPQHTLALDSIDCEDRAFLFAYLVENIVGAKTIGLQYPGHLSVAVKLKNVPESTAGLTVAGERYYFSDPTYVGASIGMSQPDYENVEAKIINPLD